MMMTTVTTTHGEQERGSGWEMQTRTGLEMHLHLEPQVCFFFPFLYYTNLYLQLDGVMANYHCNTQLPL